MIEHCVSVFKKEEEEKLYKAYLTDVLMAIAHNTGAMVETGQVMTERYAELAKWVEVDTRSGDEIAADIIKRAGLKVKE